MPSWWPMWFPWVGIETWDAETALDVLDVPPSYDLGEDRPTVLPGYRTGTIVPIGTDATASLEGVLMPAESGGQP